MIRLLLAKQANIIEATNQVLCVESQGHRMTLAGLKNHAKVLGQLQNGPIAWEDLPCREAEHTHPELLLAIHRLAERRIIEFDCVIDSRILLTATPAPGCRSANFQALEQEERYLLSRFAYLRRSGGSLLIESCTTRWSVAIHEPSLTAVVGAVSRADRASEIVQSCPQIDPYTAEECLRFMLGVGAVTRLRGHEEPEDERIPEFAQREFHDVLMHAESRIGLSSHTLGGVFPFIGMFKPMNAVKERMSDSVIPLHRPDLDAIIRDDVPLASVMEHRRSIRDFADRAITRQELGEFLFRVARVRSVNEPDPGKDLLYETTSRTYPSGGAAYDLEVYVTAWHCERLDRGLYHYEPAEHALSFVTERKSVVGAIVRDAFVASGRSGTPQAVIILASRFNRLAWKYRGISYATTLKNVGVLYEAMYLVATGMGLAPCGLGAGDSALFSKATGLDPLVESSVGEFMLGVPAES